MKADDAPAASPQAKAELLQAFQERRSPAFSTRDLNDWATALNELFAQGELDAVEYLARQLAAAYPQLPFAQTFCRFFDQTLPANSGQLPFQDDRSKDVQIVRREGADTVMLVFCSRWHWISMPLSMAHRWFGLLPVSLVYLRDFRTHYYLSGVGSLGASREETITALRKIAADLGARRVLCYGHSAGAYGALSYGLDLGADIVLGMSSIIVLDPTLNPYRPMLERYARLMKEAPGVDTDIRRRYAGAERPPRVWLYYCNNNWNDRLHAEYMAALPSVELRPVEGCGSHYVTHQLIDEGRFAALLDEFVRG